MPNISDPPLAKCSEITSFPASTHISPNLADTKYPAFSAYSLENLQFETFRFSQVYSAENYVMVCHGMSVYRWVTRKYMGVSNNRGTQKWMVYNRKTLLKWMIWGYPYFRKHETSIYFQVEVAELETNHLMVLLDWTKS